MKLYVVTADTYTECWGAEIRLYGVYSSIERAKNRRKEIKDRRVSVAIDEIDSDEECDIYLGGYIE